LPAILSVATSNAAVGALGGQNPDLGIPRPAAHREVIMPEAQDDSCPPGTVVRVLEDGYTINDRLLRPARVVVAGNSHRETNSRSDDMPPVLSRNKIPNMIR
jgi:hypothetical protein